MGVILIYRIKERLSGDGYYCCDMNSHAAVSKILKKIIVKCLMMLTVHLPLWRPALTKNSVTLLLCSI